MVEKSQDKEMNKSVAVGNVENNSEKKIFQFVMDYGQLGTKWYSLGSPIKKQQQVLNYFYWIFNDLLYYNSLLVSVCYLAKIAKVALK